MRRIGVVTVGRSDFGIYRPILKALQEDATLELMLFVTGMHFNLEHGLTVREIEAEDFPITERIEVPTDGDSPLAVARAMGQGTTGMAQALTRHLPDILLVLGDRYEMFAAALAAIPFNIPLAHIHGGELTYGAMDDALRHALSKISHLHFATAQVYAQRLHQLGEEPWRVTVCGAPSLDNLASLSTSTPDEIVQRFGISLDPAPLLVTLHPETRSATTARQLIDATLAAIQESGRPAIFTQTNADPGSAVIMTAIRSYVADHDNAQIVENLGTASYFGLMKAAAAMVGNSSSGIIEAASFALPVVNIGSRQDGRLRAANVNDVTAEPATIANAIRSATSPGARTALEGLKNPYGDGNAAPRIIEILRDVALDDNLTTKRFHDLPVSS